MCNKRNSKRIEINGKTKRIDSCLYRLIEYLNKNGGYNTVACCCGHGRYNPSVLVKNKHGLVYNVLDNKFTVIDRKRNFYRRDNKRLYYIPELEFDNTIKEKGE